MPESPEVKLCPFQLASHFQPRHVRICLSSSRPSYRPQGLVPLVLMSMRRGLPIGDGQAGPGSIKGKLDTDAHGPLWQGCYSFAIAMPRFESCR